MTKKQRLLVMNGQRLSQAEQGGAWITEKVEKAGALRPGIYALYLAQAVDKTRVHEGVIVHADSSYIYQQVGKTFVLHSRPDFDKVPVIGSEARITYAPQGRAVVAVAASTLTRGRSR